MYIRVFDTLYGDVHRADWPAVIDVTAPSEVSRMVYLARGAKMGAGTFSLVVHADDRLSSDLFRCPM